MPIGTQIDPVVHDASQFCTITALPVQNLQDLLNAIDGAPPTPDYPTAMLHTAANRLSEFFNKRLDHIEVDELLPAVERFRLYLRERRYKPGTVRGYVRHLRNLLGLAKSFGWVSHRQDVTKPWEKILECVAGRHGATQIVKYAIAIGKGPEEFTDTDLEEWRKLTLAQGRTATNVRSVAGRFRKRIFRADLSHLVPKLSPPGGTRYGVRLDDIPDPLCKEITSLIKSRMEEKLSPDRKSERILRPVSARGVQAFICRQYGYLTKVKGEQVTSLRDLCTSPRTYDFANWCRYTRQLCKRTLLSPLASLYAALKAYPSFADQNLDWFTGLLAQLEDNEEDELIAGDAKERKWVPYDILEQLPERMRRDTDQLCRKGTPQYVAAIRDILLIKWLLILPWRQRNLRECRIGLQEDGANIFKSGVRDLPSMGRPTWVQEEFDRNPNVEVWQFRFRPLQTKTGHQVRGILPRQIVILLEEYLTSFRPLLLSGCDPGTLFLTEDGRPFISSLLRHHVINATARYFGREVHPHLFRDIFAAKFLEEHPENYLTLSKILWHRDVKTTIRLYGGKYDESYGAVASEVWHEERAQRKQLPPMTGYCGKCGQAGNGRFCANCGNPTGR